MTDEILTEITNAHYASLPNKDIRQSKLIVLFSGVPGSGKSTVARAIEDKLHAVRLSNDEVRDRIVAMDLSISTEAREQAKFEVATKLLERVASEIQNIIVVDASCDRGYDYYRSWSEKHGYHIVLLRMNVPKKVIERRLHLRGTQGYRNVSYSLDKLDLWWSQWEAFGKTYTPDLVVTPEIPIETVLKVINRHAEQLLQH